MPQSVVFALILLASTEWMAAHCQRGETTQMSHRNLRSGTAKSRTLPHQRAHAEAKITVNGSKASPFDPDRPKLVEITLSETFVGDIEGESSVRALQVLRDDHSASMVMSVCCSKCSIQMQWCAQTERLELEKKDWRFVEPRSGPSKQSRPHTELAWRELRSSMAPWG
jgi:hypothetical protein